MRPASCAPAALKCSRPGRRPRPPRSAPSLSSRAGGILRWPILSIPALQPTFKAGVIKYDSRDAADPDKWDHSHWYGQLCLAYAHRFAKTFELSAEIGADYEYGLCVVDLPAE